MNTLAPYVARAMTLPAMPEVAQKLLRSFDREDLSLTELAQLVSCDQALAGKVLRLANSARFSPSHTIGTVKDAAAMLGMRQLRDLTLSACMNGALPQPAQFDRLAFWRSTMAVAGYAQTFARALDLDDEVAYTGGLMLRSGQVLMALLEPERTLEVSQRAVEPDSRMSWETTVFGCTHPDISAALAQHWHFPTALVAAFHAAPDPLASRPFNRLAAALRLASAVTDCRMQGVPAIDGLQATQGALIEHLHLDLDWLKSHLPDHALVTAGVESLLH